MLVLAWRSIRGGFLAVSLIAVALGASVAHRLAGVRLWPGLLPILAGVMLVHAGSNLWNDYADELNGADRANATPTPFNGGSRVIQEGCVTARVMARAALVCYGLGFGIALLFVRTAGWGVPFLTLLGIACGLGYSSPPAWFGGRGLGELVVAVCFGPVLAGGTALAIAGRLLPTAILASVPLGMLAAAILIQNEIPDLNADRAVGKKTLAVRLGAHAARRIHTALVVGAFLFPAAGLAGGVFPHGTALTWLSAPFALVAFGWPCKRVAVPGTLGLHALFGLLLAAGFWLG